MSDEPSKSPKSYRTAGMFFLIGGLLFTIAAAVSGEVGAFLTPGIALFIIGVALWQHSKKLRDEVNREGN